MGPICYDKVNDWHAEKTEKAENNENIEKTSKIHDLENGERVKTLSRWHSGKHSPKRLILAAVLFLLTISLLHKPVRRCYHRTRPQTIEQRARKVLETTPLIDGHIDLPMVIRYLNHGQIDNHEWRQSFKNGPFPGHVDLKRLRDGLSGGAFWSVWAPCPNSTDFSNNDYVKEVQMSYDQIDLMTRIHHMFPHDFSQPQGLRSEDAMHLFAKGNLISPLGIEGLHQIGNMASNLRHFHAMGARYATLTHNCHNKYADAALQENPFRKATPIFNGVSKDGRRMVNEMNRIGMIVDLAHVSANTMRDVLGGSDDWQGSKAPVMFSHSSAYAICPHPRNVPDDILKLVKARNSVVMVNIAGQFIACKDIGAENGLPESISEDNNLGQVVKHIMHIGNLIGFDHVGLGTDFDGIEDPPLEFEDVSRYPGLVAELLRQGVSDGDAGKIIGGNILRVWRDVEGVAAQLQANREPALEDDVSYYF